VDDTPKALATSFLPMVKCQRMLRDAPSLSMPHLVTQHSLSVATAALAERRDLAKVNRLIASGVRYGPGVWAIPFDSSGGSLAGGVELGKAIWGVQE
jgi:hypothetical protein